MKEKLYKRIKDTANIQKSVNSAFDHLYEDITEKKANHARLSREGMLREARKMLAQQGANFADGKIYDIEYLYQDVKTAKQEMLTLEYIFSELFGETLIQYHDK